MTILKLPMPGPVYLLAMTMASHRPEILTILKRRLTQYMQATNILSHKSPRLIVHLFWLIVLLFSVAPAQAQFGCGGPCFGNGGNLGRQLVSGTLESVTYKFTFTREVFYFNNFGSVTVDANVTYDFGDGSQTTISHNFLATKAPGAANSTTDSYDFAVTHTFSTGKTYIVTAREIDSVTVCYQGDLGCDPPFTIDSGACTRFNDFPGFLSCGRCIPAVQPCLRSAPQVSIAPTVAKAIEGGTTGVFTVTRTGSTASSLTVLYQVGAASTATSGVDYQALSGSVVIPTGQSSTTINIVAIADGVPEGDETVILSLQSNAAYTVGAPNSATVTISDSSCGPDPVTILSLVDSDGDGIPDECEQRGYTTPDGKFIDLPGMGADPNKPDIFVQLDWMAGTKHDHKLPAEAIKKVVDAFAAAPYKSPTGSVGINLHVDHGPGSADFVTGQTWGNLSKARALAEITPLHEDFSEFIAIKIAAGGFVGSGRGPIFHYAISAHDLVSRASGLSSDIGASDFIISLAQFSADQQMTAGTFMHELGHNLDLRHGGNDDKNFKPNYLSVMNYSFQFFGLLTGGRAYDYSRKQLITLDEANLDETKGLGSDAAGFGTRHFCRVLPTDPGTWNYVLDARGPINWDCHGDANERRVIADINGESEIPEILEVLEGYDDWSHIQFKKGSIGLFGAPLPLPVASAPETLTPEIADRIVPWPVGGTTVTIKIKPNTSPSPVNLKSGGVIPVAILSTPNFDARTIDPLSARFGPGGAFEVHSRGHFEDVNGDGYIDLMLHFDVSYSGLVAGQTNACLTAKTFQGTAINGCDAITTISK